MVGDRKPVKRVPSASSEALGRLLLGDGPIARILRKQYERSMLWRPRSGRRTPSLGTAFDLAKVTHGRLSLQAWFRPHNNSIRGDESRQRSSKRAVRSLMKRDDSRDTVLPPGCTAHQ